MVSDASSATRLPAAEASDQRYAASRSLRWSLSFQTTSQVEDVGGGRSQVHAELKPCSTFGLNGARPTWVHELRRCRALGLAQADDLDDYVLGQGLARRCAPRGSSYLWTLRSSRRRWARSASSSARRRASSSRSRSARSSAQHSVSISTRPFVAAAASLAAVAEAHGARPDAGPIRRFRPHVVLVD